MLAAIGISEDEEAIYRAVVRAHSPVSADDLKRLEVGALASIRRSLIRLEEAGLVTRVAGSPMRFVAARPDSAIQVLVRRRQEQLERALLTAQELLKDHLSAPRRDPGELVEVILGRNAIYQRYQQMQLSAQEQVVGFDRPPYASDVPGPANQAEIQAIARGVDWRSVYDRSVLELPGRIERIREIVRAGEQARVGDVPMKLVIVDQQQALIPLSIEEPGFESAVIVHRSSLLQALYTLFESLWARAVPFRDELGTDEKRSLDAEDSRILGLLAVGLKDEAIAHHLGMGTRTVRRRIAQLMEELGAATRFQAGLQAAKQGLI